MSFNVDKKTITSSTQTNLLEGLLDQLMNLKGVRHAILAVESLDGSFSWRGARGTAQPKGDPMEIETPFWIASVTKLFIASAILKLHETGRLSIDDLVIDYLPEDLLKGVHIINGLDYYNRLSIRHLLSHASGIPDYLEIKQKGEGTLIDRVLEGHDISWSLEDILQIVRNVNAPHFQPQDLSSSQYRIRYSDTNFQILIAIIERVTEKPIEDVYREMLFQPLDLGRTFLPGSKPPASVEPTAAVWVENTPFNNKPLAMRSFGDLNSTVVDLIAFMRALINGKVFARAETLDLMCGIWQTFGFSLSQLAPGWPIQYGLGMMRFRMPRPFAPFRPMPEVIGHTGAVGSWLFYCPKLELILTGTVGQLTAAAAPFKLTPKLLRILG